MLALGAIGAKSIRSESVVGPKKILWETGEFGATSSRSKAGQGSNLNCAWPQRKYNATRAGIIKYGGSVMARILFQGMGSSHKWRQS